MPESNRLLSLNRIMRHSDLGIAVALLGGLLVMLVPLAPTFMDILFVTSITLSIAIMLLAVYADRPLDFSIFPTVLLFSTLFRLSLNVASSRLILLNGHTGSTAAGRVIETFGDYVVGGNFVVGAVIFLLLIVINFVVITKGAGRVAEVAARFILDAMPGKQMSIDADLNAGLISDVEAKERRKKIEEEADFYGAMDGASKFVRGDAIAGIVIVIINIIGGLAIGIFQKDLGAGTAAELYTLMTIGDGMVTQIPALIVSTAAGIIVTRAASGNNLSKEFAKQMVLQPRAIGITAVILFMIGMAPGIPLFPFFLLSSITGVVAYWASRSKRDHAVQQSIEEQKKAENEANEGGAPPTVDILELQVGYGLVNLVDPEQHGDLVDRIFQLRKEFAKELGIVVPKVRIKDNLELQPSEYSVLIKGVSVGTGDLMIGYCLAMDPGNVETPMTGIDTKEPVFGLPAIWVPEKQKEEAQMRGYTVVDSSTIMATHLSEIIRKHSQELIGRQEVQNLIDNISKTHPKVVEELIPKVLPLGTVVKVCQNLLKEQVPIRDLLTVLETLANYGGQTKDPDILSEYVRAALARTITQRLTQGREELEVIRFDPRTEEAILRTYKRTETGQLLDLEPAFFESLVRKIQNILEQTVFASGTPVLICNPAIRGVFKRTIDRFVPGLQIISGNEVAQYVRLKPLATVEA